MSAAQTNFYVTGGTLQRNAPSYVKRQADDDLYAGLGAGRFCYVLTSRQMGKSSLMVQTAARLRDEGMAVAVLDLTAVGQNLTAEQWYDGLLSSAGRQLKLEDELEDFWLENERTGPLQRWMRAIREIVLERIKGRIVIFVDEIDAVRSLPFSTDEFFAAIRECYNRRTQDVELQRLTFCLLGVATPSDLISDTRTTPFNIGQRIELTDFTEQEAAPLAAGLNRPPEFGAQLLHRILYWTGGHPYLTQRLCQAVAEDETIKSPSGVDQLCEDLFLSARARERDDNLLFVRERLLRSDEADRAALLDLYAQVRTHKRRVRDDETNPRVSILRLSGITRITAGYHYVRNRIYYRVFDREWINANMPDAELQRQRAAYRRGIMRAALYATIVLAVMGVLSLYAFSQQRQAVQARNRAEAEAQRADRNAEEARRALAEATQERQKAEQAQGTAEKALKEAEAETQVAQQQRTEAETQRKKAEQAVIQTRLANERSLAAVRGQVQAMQTAQQAKLAEQQTRRLLYAVHMSQAQQAWNDGNVDRVQKLLSNYQPTEDTAHAIDADEDVRGFEWHYLWRLSHGTLTTHALPAQTLRGTPYLTAFSGDGARLVVASAVENKKEQSLVSVWDAHTGQFIASADYRMYKLQINDPTVQALALSPDGTKLVTGHQGAAALLDARTGQIIRTFSHEDTAPKETTPTQNEHGETVREIAYKPASPAAELIQETEEPLVVGAVAFSPDGRLFATGVRGGFGATHPVRLWYVNSGREFATLSGHTGDIFALSFAPNGKLLASAGADEVIKLWVVPASATTEQSIAPVATINAAESAITLLAFSPDGRILAAGCADHTVRLWDTSTGQRLGSSIAKLTQEITSIAFAPDGRRLATTSADKTICVWAVPNVSPQPTQPEQAPKKTAAAPPTSLPSWLQPAVYQPGRDPVTNILTAQWLPALPVANISINSYRPASEKAPEPLTVLKGHKGAVLSLKFSADGQHLTTFGADEALKVWAAEHEPDWRTFGYFRGIINGLAFSPDGRTLAIGGSGTGGQSLALWDTATGRERLSLKSSGGIFNVAFSPDGQVLASARPNGVELWDVKTGTALGVLKHQTQVYAVAFAPHGQLIATSGSDGTVKLWDARTYQERMTLKGHYKPVESVAFSPDGKLLATASHDETIKLWDVVTGQEHMILRNPREVRAVAFSPDGKLLATGDADNLVKLWDATTGQLLATLEGHIGPISYLAFSPDGRRIATSSDDGSVRLWAVESRQEVAEFKGQGGAVFVVAFAPDGQTIATGNKDGSVRLYDTTEHPAPQTKLLPEADATAR